MSSSDGLAKNSLGVFESIIMGIAGTAPAFSVAVTSAAIVASVGVLSVGSILYCGNLIRLIKMQMSSPLFLVKTNL